jgi:hypothetical protein
MKPFLTLAMVGFAAFGSSAFALEGIAINPAGQVPLSNESAGRALEVLKKDIQDHINHILTCYAKGRVYTPSTTVPGQDADGCFIPPELWLKGSGNNIYYNGGLAGVNTNSPSQQLDVNGYVRIRSTNGEGGTIQMDGNNGQKIWIENLNGRFRLINDPWNKENFSVYQNGDADVYGQLYNHNQIYVNAGWNPAQALAINSNQIWKAVTTGDSSLYFQWSVPGGAVVVGGQNGATNNLNTYGRTYSRDGYRCSVSASFASTIAMARDRTISEMVISAKAGSSGSSRILSLFATSAISASLSKCGSPTA